MPDESGRARRLYVRLTRDRCTRDYGVGPCAAALGVTGDAKCYRTFPSCQDPENYDRGSVTYVFGQNVAGHPKTGTIFPALIDVSERPVEVNLSGVDPRTTALGKRARVTATFRDFTYHDAVTDPYHLERRSGAAQADGLPRDPGLGTFWGKLDARDPFFEGRRMEVVRCLPGDDPFTAPGAAYDVAEMSGPASARTVTITAQDPLNLLDGARSLYPPPSQGELVADIEAGDATLTLQPAGIGDLDYPAAGLVAVGREIMAFARSGDVLTLTQRGAEGTTVAAHKAGDAAQIVAIVTGRISDALVEVLTGLGGPVDPALIDVPAWAAEHDAWMGGTTVRAVLWQPNSRSLLAGELLQLGVGLVYDETEPALTFFVNAPKSPGEVYPLLSDEGRLIRDTVEVTRAHEGRISGVYVHHGLSDPTAEAQRAASYARHNFVTDPSSASALEWGSERIQTIALRWFGREGNSAAVKVLFQRLISRYRNAPHVVAAQVDARDLDVVRPGARALVQTRALQGMDGTAQPVLMQINRRVPRGGRVEFRAESFGFDGRFGFYMATPACSAFLGAAGRYMDIDARLIGLVWQTETTASPVTAAGQSVGRCEGLARAMPVSVTQATAGRRPLWQSTWLEFDGTDDRLDGAGPVLDLLRNVGKTVIGCRFRVGAIGTTQRIISFSTSAVGTARLGIDVLGGGNLQVTLRRLDADGATTLTTVTNPVSAGADVSFLLCVDWDAGPVDLYINGGADEVTGSVGGTPGPTSDTASGRVRVGATQATTPGSFLGGRLYRLFVSEGALPDAPTRAAMFADLAAPMADYDDATDLDRDEGAYWIDAGETGFGDGTGPYIYF